MAGHAQVDPEEYDLGEYSIVSRPSTLEQVQAWVRRNIVTTKWFDRTVIVIILLNCIALGMEVPGVDTPLQRVLTYVEYVFTLCFTVEMLLKIIGLGPYKYFKDPWNSLDAVIVASGLTSMILDALKLNAGVSVGGLRALRMLRPLRVVAGVPEIRIIVNSLILSFRLLLDVMLLYSFFAMFCGIFALQLWQGSLRNRCVKDIDGGQLIGDRICRITSTNTGNLQGYQCPWGWECREVENPMFGKVSFDNIFITLLTMFTTLTLEWWTVIMYFCSDATTVLIAAPYFIILVLVGSFFIINLSLVIINDAFQQYVAKEREEKSQLLMAKGALEHLAHGDSSPKTEKPTGSRVISQWVKSYKEKLSSSQGEEKAICLAVGKARAWLRRIVEGRIFTWTITAVIVINTLLFTIDHYPMDPELDRVLTWANNICTGIFTLECVLKILALGIIDFCREWFNIFDLLVVIISVVDVIFQAAPGLSVLRSFRLLRVFRLARSFEGLQKWLKIVFASAVEASWLTMLLILVIYIFALLGMQFFGTKFCCLDTPELPPDAPECQVNNEDFCLGRPRQNFDRLQWAIITVFQILTGEDWNALMYTGMRAQGDFASLYYVSCFIIGNYLVLNLFIAVLLNNRALQEEDQATKGCPDAEEAKNHEKSRKCCGFLCNWFQEKRGRVPSMKPSEAMKSEEEEDPRWRRQSSRWEEFVRRMSDEDKNSQVPASGVQSKKIQTVSAPEQVITYSSFRSHDGKTEPGVVSASTEMVCHSSPRSGGGMQQQLPGCADEEMNSPSDEEVPSRAEKESIRAPRAAARINPLPLESMMPRNDSNKPKKAQVNETSNTIIQRKVNDISPKRDVNIPKLWIPDPGDTASDAEIAMQVRDDDSESGYGSSESLATIIPERGSADEDSSWRDHLLHYVTGEKFEYVVIALILLSSVVLSLETPFQAPDSRFAKDLNTINLMLTICFTVEMLLKITAMGFVVSPKSYLRDSWNVLDFVIVLASLISVSSPALNSLTILKMLRTLRPLRFISRSPGLRLVLDALLSSIPPLGNVALISIFFWLIFGILGMGAFKGKFASCRGLDMGGYNQTVCEEEGGTWESYPSTFDNMGSSFLTLFEIATLEGWVDVMWAGMDATEIGQAPEINVQPLASLYFIWFIIICSFFLVNLCVGVLIDNYYKLHNEDSQDAGMSFMTPDQQDWIRMQKIMMQSTITFVSNKIQPPKNGIRMYLYQLVTKKRFDHAISMLICLNIAILATEHYRQAQYWTEFIQISSIVFTSLYFIEFVIKVVAFGWRGYIYDRWNCFDAFILFTSIVFYCIMLVQYVIRGSTSDTEVEGFFRVMRLLRLLRVLKVAKGIRTLIRTLVLSIPSLANVAGLLFLLIFFYALLGVKLFGKIVRQENLNDHANFESSPIAMQVMLRMATGEAWNFIMKDCQVQPPHCVEHLGECGVAAAPLYFCSFMVLGMYILLNLFIAVILDNFADVQEEEELPLTFHDIQYFREQWNVYDPYHTLYIPAVKVPAFLYDLGPPLGFCDTNTAAQIQRQVCNLNLNVTRGKVRFEDLLIGLAEYAHGVKLPMSQVWDLEKEWAMFAPRIQKRLKRNGRNLETYAAIKLQKVWRGYTVRRRNMQNGMSFSLGRSARRPTHLQAKESSAQTHLSDVGPHDEVNSPQDPPKSESSASDLSGVPPSHKPQFTVHPVNSIGVGQTCMAGDDTTSQQSSATCNQVTSLSTEPTTAEPTTAELTTELTTEPRTNISPLPKRRRSYQHGIVSNVDAQISNKDQSPFTLTHPLSAANADQEDKNGTRPPESSLLPVQPLPALPTLPQSADSSPREESSSQQAHTFITNTNNITINNIQMYNININRCACPHPHESSEAGNVQKGAQETNPSSVAMDAPGSSSTTVLNSISNFEFSTSITKSGNNASCNSEYCKQGSGEMS